MYKLEQARIAKKELHDVIKNGIDKFISENPDVCLSGIDIEFTKYYSDKLLLVSLLDDIEITINI